ncbi:hypothetical protein SJ05684_c04990 [Sinorhizobium sojae CCBAU 05684]|uniref:Uncharacterized protein n=1 Tax=Sinorhizobium sojae CCBAU 05684 TaxID=716928 RepID=A0A249P876_9HYPH|nr:hypothetical protein SJ05684_c04990 [Sinorhizobium sojae CCBAU 05684]
MQQFKVLQRPCGAVILQDDDPGKLLNIGYSAAPTTLSPRLCRQAPAAFSKRG